MEQKAVAGLIPATIDGKRVKNLGWILRNWKAVESFEINKHPPVIEKGFQPECVFIAHLKDGRTYQTGFMSASVLDGFLNRPIFKGVPQVWNTRK